MAGQRSQDCMYLKFFFLLYFITQVFKNNRESIHFIEGKESSGNSKCHIRGKTIHFIHNKLFKISVLTYWL